MSYLHVPCHLATAAHTHTHTHTQTQAKPDSHAGESSSGDDKRSIVSSVPG